MKILNILNMIIKYNNAIRTSFTSIEAARQSQYFTDRLTES